MTDSHDNSVSDEVSLDDVEITLGDDAPAEQEPELDLEALATEVDDPEESDDDGGLNLDFEGSTADEPDDESDISLNFDDEGEAEPEEGPAEDAELSEEAEAALAELREHLRFAPGEWYVIHTYSGMENRVKQNLESRVRFSNKPGSTNMEEYIHEVVVPTEQVEEMRGNQKKMVTRTVLPGYVLVRMELTDESWATVRHTPSVTGFIGHGQDPVPISAEEVEHMMTRSVLAKVAQDTGKKATRKKKASVAAYEVNESVQVTDGPFTGVHGTVTEVNPAQERVKVLVELLGRETPIDLTFEQVTKIQ